MDNPNSQVTESILETPVKDFDTMRKMRAEPLLVSSRTAQVGWHVFVDNVRFWSMLAIIAIHATGAFDLVNAPSSWKDALKVPLKFGTVGFFLISGFLLGERLQTSRRTHYFGRRVKKVFLPWLIWVTVFITYTISLDLLHHRFVLSLHNLLPVLFGRLRDCLLSTSFWFVPNLLLALLVLLALRRYLYDIRLGLVLLAVHLFYVVNIYRLWIPSSHLEALFGFVFDLWLGSFASKHIVKMTQWISEISLNTMVALTLVSLTMAYAETLLLVHLHSVDPSNTLRFTNQIYSIMVVLFLMKIPTASWPRFVNVRRDTFGLYLTHSIVMDLCCKACRRIPPFLTARLHMNQGEEGVFLWILVLVLTYTGSLLITRVLASSPETQWLVGAEFPVPTPRHFPRFLQLGRFSSLTLRKARTFMTVRSDER
ncbi:acyltransferase family protein [Granulicella arctica]|uniref:acyltransferase family protein n=1 Tax=Granulicella arctica TaxID=940613 RepID=UPI0021E01E0D|nr:acyltransferase [Granulicella arctica]